MENPRILIVEDEFIIAKDIQISLENMGFTVCGLASSGSLAVEKAETEQPDLILMDIMLKGSMDGIEAASRIISTLPVPVVYLTAYGDDEILERAKQTTPFGFLIKPFKDRELRATIEMALYKHRMEQERETLLNELKEALDKVKTLSGLLPMCAKCKKIRDDKGYWNQLEEYIQAHSDAQFSHAVCPECSDELYGHQEWYQKMKSQRK